MEGSVERDCSGGSGRNGGEVPVFVQLQVQKSWKENLQKDLNKILI